MRARLIFLSFGVFLTIIQYANGAPRRVRSLESDEVRDMMRKLVQTLEAYVDDHSTGESEEEEREKITDAIELVEKSSSEESDTESNEQDDGDKEVIFPHFIDTDHEELSQSSDEN